MTIKKGFTIIEVALVLAIAGIIFIMVFIALPALQASQRDTERRDDVMTFVQQLKNFSGNNNRGALPDFSVPKGSADDGNQNKYNNGGTVERSGEELRALSDDEKENLSKNSWDAFYLNYFDESFADPDGGYYNLVISKCNTNDSPAVSIDEPCPATNDLIEKTFPNNNELYVIVGGTCDGEYAKLSANSRKVAVLYKLEAGGAYCQNT